MLTQLPDLGVSLLEGMSSRLASLLATKCCRDEAHVLPGGHASPQHAGSRIRPTVARTFIFAMCLHASCLATARIPAQCCCCTMYREAILSRKGLANSTLQKTSERRSLFWIHVCVCNSISLAHDSNIRRFSDPKIARIFARPRNVLRYTDMHGTCTRMSLPVCNYIYLP